VHVARRRLVSPITPIAFPFVYWDVFGQASHPVRTTIWEMGPLLLIRLMELSETQEGILNIAFRVADEPALQLSDLMLTDAAGYGGINILAADKLMNSPRLYATFLLWLLSELFETLPEAGDPEKPEMVFFFDEAHLLFDDAPKALIDKVEQVARLIRPPSSQLGPVDGATRAALIAVSPLKGKYDVTIDRDSAFKVLTRRVAEAAAAAEQAEARESETESAVEREFSTGRWYSGTRVDRSTAQPPAARRSSSRSDSVGEAFAKSLARQMGTQSGRAIVRGVLRGLFRGR
jgi:hypothetical protein